MKRTLTTVAITAIIVLTLVGIASSALFNPGRSTLSNANYGFGGGGGDGAEYYAVEPAMPASEAPMVDSAGAPPMDIAKSMEETVNAQGTDGDRLVIRNADLAIVVKDPKADMAKISQLAEEMGGFVVSSNLYQSYYGPNNIEVPEATITIRVPSERLDEALDRIKEDAVDVNYENTSGMDVTNEYVDLQSRLAAKEAAEEKLLEIMENAEDDEAVLAIYTQVQIVQTEIEVLKGQIKYYEESAALSAVSVRLIAEEGTQPITIGPWRPEGAAKEAVEDLVLFLQNFVEFLIRFVIFTLPSLIMIAIPLYLLFLGGRAIYRRFWKSTLAPHASAGEAKVEEVTEEKK